MGLTLISYPVEIVGGEIQNVLPGFDEILVTFQRADAVIDSYQNVSNKLRVNGTTIDYTKLSIGDYVYIKDDYFYNSIGLVTDLGTQYITTDIDFITSSFAAPAATPYVNYFQNYYVEFRLIELFTLSGSYIDLERVLVNSLVDVGTPSGLITLDASIANDKNRQLPITDGELNSDNSTKFVVEYREVYDDVPTSSFTRLTEDEIISAYATEHPDIDTPLSRMTEPIMYDGYNNIVGVWHSELNNAGNHIELTYDELDLNKVALTSANALETFAYYEYGLMSCKLSSFGSTVKYVRINVNTEV